MIRTVVLVSSMVLLACGGGGGGTGGGGGGGAGGGGGGAGQGGSFTIPALVMSTQAASGSDGVLHIAHHTSGGRIVYGRCAQGCGDSAQWQFVELEAVAYANNTRLAVGPDQRVHLVYSYSTGSFAYFLVYATCASDCGTAANWVKTELAIPADCDSPENSGLVLDAQGRLSFLTSDANDTRACLVTCAGACTTASNWQSGLIATAVPNGPRSAFVLAGHGTTLHLLFNDGQVGLRYQSCGGQCTNPANWQLSPPLFYHAGTNYALTASPQGALTLAYNQGELPASAPADARAADNQLHLFQCTGNCGDSASWQGFSTGLTDGVFGVAVTERGGQVAVATAQTAGVRLYLCGQGNCGVAAGWGAGDVETITSLNAAMPDPLSVTGCEVNGQPVAPQQAAWHPEKPSVALTADAALVHVATEGLRTCPGVATPVPYSGNGRLHYVR